MVKTSGLHELDANLAGKALAATSGILYAACVALIAIWPAATMDLFAKMFHGIDITKIAGAPAGLDGVLLGFVQIIVYGFLAGWIFAKAYNYFLKK